MRHAQLGLAFGLGLGVVGQLVVALFAPTEHEAGWGMRAGAVIYGAATWVALAVVLAAITQLWLRHRVGRLAALVLSTALLAGVALVEAMGITLRLLTGTYLTTGAVMFSLNSSQHFLHAAAGNYLGTALGIVFTLVVFVATVWRLLRPAALPTTRAVPAPRLLVLGVVLGTIVLLIYTRRGESDFTRRMFVSGPLVALIGSLDDTGDSALARTSIDAAALGMPLAPPGPPLSDGERWLQQIEKSKGPRPNVILLGLESIAFKHLGYNGYSRDTTPNLDRLAGDGLNMMRAWTTATHSNYAQPAVLSSLFPRRGHGLDQYTRIDYPRMLFHDVMHRLGYTTATISSQDESWQGMRRFQDTGTPTFYWYSADYVGGHLDTGTEKIVPDGDTVDVILSWLDEQKGKPWAVYINFQATHFPYLIPSDIERPWQPSDPDASTFTYLRYPEDERDVVINRYDNALRYVDAQVGRIIEDLEHHGALEDTLWIITADHGETFFDKGLVTHGKTLYEVESRVPLIVHWPRMVMPEERDEPVSHLDIMPTLLDLLGLPPHPSFQGRSFVAPDPAGVGHHPIYMNIQGLRFADAIVCWPYKLIFDRTSEVRMLFDLAADPDETQDLIGTRPQLARRLGTAMQMQFLAQLEYHAEESPILGEQYAPRLRPCPQRDGSGD